MNLDKTIADLRADVMTPEVRDALTGSMYEERWRGNLEDFDDYAWARNRAIERLEGFAFHGERKPAGEVPPLGVGWGTYRWRYDPACVEAAVRYGAAVIDTAATYGYGRVEKALGESGFLRDRGPDIWVATKFSRNHARPGPLRNSCERSLKALGLDRLDLLQLHWPCFYVVPLDVTLSAMEELRTEGLVRSLGLCNVSLDMLHEARRFAQISTVQVARQHGQELLEHYCTQNGIRLIAHSPFLQKGVLSDLNRWVEDGWTPIPGSNDPGHIRENLRRD